MTLKSKTSRILGVAFLLQFITSFISGVLQKSTLFAPESIKNVMLNIAQSSLLMNITLFLDMLTALGVIFLGSVLFVILKSVNEKLALTAFGFYLLEGAIHVFSKVEAFNLFKISEEYIANGQPDLLLTMGNIAFASMEFAGIIMMLAFCIGAMIFYFLMVKSRIVPNGLSIWGLVTVSLLLIWTILAFFNYKVPFFFYLPYVPFELAIGIWILIKGINLDF